MQLYFGGSSYESDRVLFTASVLFWPFFVSFIAKFAISVVHDMQQRLSNAYVHGQVWMLSCMGVWVCTPVFLYFSFSHVLCL